MRPTEGDVLVDGQAIGQIGLADYGAGLGVVMQDDQLFAGSIAENIAFFADNIVLVQVEACAKKAAVHDAIMALPMGYATLIGAE